MADGAYSIAETAKLLGLTPDGVRKRVEKGTLTPAPAAGAAGVSAGDVDRERAALLRKLQAYDARLPQADDCVELRAEVARLKVVIEALARAGREHLDAIESAIR